jgi:hypothetical protein
MGGMMDVTQVIEAFGGYSQAQLLFGVSRSLLAEWEVKGIPPKRWLQLVELARRLDKPGITVEALSTARPSKTKAA